MLVNGHNGNMHAKSAEMTPREMASDLKIPWHNLAHFWCAFAIPIVACFYLSPPGYFEGADSHPPMSQVGA